MNPLDAYIKPALETLYSKDELLFSGNLSERCIVFRFAHYLQNVLNSTEDGSRYFVDCDYNSSVIYNEETGEYIRVQGKKIQDLLTNRNEGVVEEMKSTGRFVDIIVHKRSHNKDKDEWSDFFCIELKKWNNITAVGVAKDCNNLEQLTSYFGYEFGYRVILGEKKEDTEVQIFTEGQGVVLNKVFQ